MAVNHNINITATDKTGQALSNIDRKLSDIDGKAGSVTKALGAAGAAALAFASSSVLGGMVKQYTAFEKYNTVLATYLGSQSAANSEMKRLQQLANALPQDLNDITQAFVLFTSRGIDTSSKSLTAFSNIATANGKSLTQLGEAVADALTGEFERMKEFGIKISKENDKFVADIGNGNKLVGKSAADLVNQLRALGEEGGKFGNAAANNANTLAQTFSNLEGAIMEASVAFGTGLGPGMKTFVQTVTEIIRQNKDMISQLGNVLGSIMVNLGKTLMVVVDNMELMRQAAIGILGVKLGTAIAGLAIGFKNLAGTILGATKGLTQFNKASLRNVIGALLGLGLIIADNMGLMDKMYQKLGLMDKPDAMDPLITKLEQVTAEMEKVKAAGGINEINKLSERTAGMLAQELHLRKQVNAEATKKYEEALKSNRVDIDALKIVNQTAAAIQQAENALAAYVAAKKAAAKTPATPPAELSAEQQNYNLLLTKVKATSDAEKLRISTLALVRSEIKSGTLTQEQYNNALEVEKLLVKDSSTAAQKMIKGLSEQNAELKVLKEALKNISSLTANTTVTDNQATKAIKERIAAIEGAKTVTQTYTGYLKDLNTWIEKDAQSKKWAADATAYLNQQFKLGKISAEALAAGLEHLNGKTKESDIPTYAKYWADLNKQITDSRQQSAWAAKATEQLTAMHQAGLITADEYAKTLEKLNGKKDPSTTQTLINSLKTEEARIKELTDAYNNADAIVAGTGVSVEKFKQAIEKDLNITKDTSYADYFKNITDAIAKETQTTEWASKAQWDLIQMRAEGKISAEQLAAALEKLNGKQASEITVTQATTKAISDAKKKLDELKAAYKNADSAVAGTNVTVGEFKASIQGQIKTQETAITGLTTFKDKATETAEELQKTWQSIGQSMSKSMSDAVAKGELTFTSFKDFLKQWAQQIVSQIIQKTLMDPITNQLASLGAQLVGGIGGSAGGGIASMLGSLFGGGGMSGSIFDLFSGSFLGFANGGVPPVNQPSIVGENGPELFVPKSSGTVVPNDALGGGSLNVTFQINAIDQKSGAEFILNNKQQIVGVIQDAYNRRGKQGIY